MVETCMCKKNTKEITYCVIGSIVPLCCEIKSSINCFKHLNDFTNKMVIICLPLNIKRKYTMHKFRIYQKAYNIQYTIFHDDSLETMCANILIVKNSIMRHSYHCSMCKHVDKL